MKSRDAATILSSRTLVDAFNKPEIMGRDSDELQAGIAIMIAAHCSPAGANAGSARHADARIFGRQVSSNRKKKAPRERG